jgi:hypothetical protein
MDQPRPSYAQIAATAAAQAAEIRHLQTALEAAHQKVERLQAALDAAQAALVDQTQLQHAAWEQDEMALSAVT